MSLETYRKSGAPVKTTVWLVLDAGSLYVRTSPKSGKAKRLRRNPRVRLAPSDMRGNVKGEWMSGEAGFVEGADAPRIATLFRKKYGFMVALVGLWMRITRAPAPVFISIRILPAGGTASSDEKRMTSATT